MSNIEKKPYKVLRPCTASSKPVVVTSHARERWMERVADPDRYSHLHHCRLGCATCVSLLHDMRSILSNIKRIIDQEIATRTTAAIKGNNRVQEDYVLELARKLFPEKKCDYYRDVRKPHVILVLTYDTIGPVVVSVLTQELLEGVAMRAADSKEARQNLFRHWKHQAQQRGRS